MWVPETGLAFRAIVGGHKISIARAEVGTVIDITCALKTFSIAAAIASLNRDLLFVYAGTGNNTGRVLAYDASITLMGGGSSEFTLRNLGKLL